MRSDCHLVVLVSVVVVLTVFDSFVLGRNIRKSTKLSLGNDNFNTGITLDCTDCKNTDLVKTKTLPSKTFGTIHSHVKKDKRHRRRNKNSRRRRRRRRKHLKQNVSRTGTITSSRRMAVHDTPQKDWPWNTNRREPSVPASVRRLEQAIRPTLANSVRNLKHTLSQILQKMQKYLGDVKTDYGDLKSSTKEDMMQVRKILQIIADENDKAYDVMLEVSQLVRYIMLRAHEHGLVGPTPVIFPPEMLKMNFNGQFQTVNKMRQIAELSLSRSMEYKRRFNQMDSKMTSVVQNDQPKVPNNALTDLQMISRKVLRKLEGKIMSSVAAMKLKRYKAFDIEIKDNMNQARTLSSTAYQDIKYSQRLLQDNKVYHQRIKSRQASSKLLPNQTSTVNTGESELHKETETSLADLVNRAYMASRNLQKTESILNRTMVPLLITVKKTPHGNRSSQVVRDVRRIAENLQSLTMKLSRKLDELRIFLGDEDIFKERCDALGEGSGDESVATDTIIDCEQFGVGLAGSGSGDEDLLPVTTTRPKSLTTLTPGITTTPPAIIDGSGDGEFEFTDKGTTESSWFGFPFGDDPNAYISSTSIFDKKLKERALFEKEKSETIFKEADVISVKAAVFQPRLSNISSVKDNLQIYVSNAMNVTKAWNVTKTKLAKEKLEIEKINADFLSKLDTDLTRLKAAKSAAILKVESYKKIMDERKSTSSVQDADMLTALIDTVDNVKKNTHELKRFKKDSKDPCKKLELAATKLRNNIAELRDKIKKVRQITTNLPVSISLEKDSMFSVALTGDSRLQSPTTSFGMCIKPLNDNNMHLASLIGNSSMSYKVDIVDQSVQLTVKDSSGDEKGILKTTTSLSPNTWHRLNVKRFGNALEVTTENLGTKDGPVKEAIAITDMNPLQVSPSNFYFGSDAQSDTHFSGCVGDITVNGKDIGLLNSHRKGPALKVCGTRCLDTSKRAMVFEGDGFAKFDLDMLHASSRMENIKLEFRSRQSDGIIFLLNDRMQDLQILVSLLGGAIHLEGRVRRGTTVKRSGLKSYADGSIHTIQLIFETDSIEVQADNGTDQFGLETSTQEITKTIDDGIFLGGLGVQSQMVTGKTKLRPLTGCITKLEIGSQQFPLYMARESKNVLIGDCTQNIWFNCVRFQDTSKPVILNTIKDLKSINIVVSRDSVGRILHYKNGEKFNIEVRVDGTGLEIYDVREDDKYVLSSIPNPKDTWFSIRLQDKPDKVIISLNGTSEEIQYTSGGGWFGGNKKRDDYSLTIGGSKEDNNTRYTGNVARILVNDKPIDLLQYTRSHDLPNCEKPLMTVTEKVPKSEDFKLCS